MGRSAPVGRVRRAEFCWALILALLGAIGGIEPTEARSPSDPQQDKAASRNNRRDSQPQSRAAPPARDNRNDAQTNTRAVDRGDRGRIVRDAASDRPARQETAAPRVQRQDSVPNRQPTISVQATPPSKASDQRKSSDSAGNRNSGSKISERQTPKVDVIPPRRIGSGEVTKPIDRNTTGDAPKTRPPVGNAEQSKPSDVRRRLGQPDRKSEPPTVGRDRTKLPPAVDHRAKDVRWDRMAPKETAKQLRLSEQYHMSKKGDVARRLDLQKHV
ncbi:MAG: hypothetical protein ABFC54_03050, partial [Thermoguttaceae bacterium]